jgi:hypothetical protein
MRGIHYAYFEMAARRTCDGTAVVTSYGTENRKSRTMRFTFFFCCLAVTGLSFAQQGLVPYSPSSRVDKQGNEWNLEQNGMVNRPNSGTPSILSGCGTLMIGNQQFYTNQPMSTPDGKEVVLIFPHSL